MHRYKQSPLATSAVLPALCPRRSSVIRLSNLIGRRVRKLLTFALAGFVLFLLSNSPNANGGNCRLTEEQFIKQMARMSDWPTIYAVFKQNLPACPDDGFFAEGYTEVVVRTLAKHWADIGQLQKLVTRDARFRHFVYRHIDGTADLDDLHQVLNNARTRCPEGSGRLCAEIALRAKAAVDPKR